MNILCMDSILVNMNLYKVQHDKKCILTNNIEQLLLTHMSSLFEE